MARIIITVIFIPVIFAPIPYNETIALVLFCLGGITDHLDGRLARKYNLITNFGSLMDPLADKLLTCSAFIAFVQMGLMPAWMVVIIVARELAITGLRTLAVLKNVVLAAEGFGKHKTVSQIVCIIAMLIMISYPQWGAVSKAFFGFSIFGCGPWIVLVAEAAKWIAVFLTIVSGSLYLMRNRQMFLHDA